MKRRTFIQALCVSPLGFLTKKRKPTFTEALEETADEFDSVLVEMPDTTTNTEHYYENAGIGSTTSYLTGPVDSWAKAAAEKCSKSTDKAIIKVLL